MDNKIILNISGMTCASCAASIKRALDKTPGIFKADINFARKKALVEFDSEKINEQQIIQAISQTGYQAQPEGGSHGEHHHPSEGQRRNFIWAAVLSLPLLLEMVKSVRVGIVIGGQDIIMWVHLILATIIVWYFGWRFHRMAWKLAKRFSSNMDTLISLGTITAYFYSLWAIFNNREGYLETAAIIIVLILLGKYFEARSTRRAGEAMRKLLELKAQKARVFIDGYEEEKDIEDVKAGDVVIVKPGEKIPLDGEVLAGESSVDESMLTGESMPIDKNAGSTVFGSTINENGTLKIKVTKTGEGTMLAQIIKTVEETQMAKAPVERLADRISGIFVPTVLFLAIITFLIGYFYTGIVSLSIIRAIAVLIIACPCALGLATPTAIMVGTGRGSSRGILFKKAEIFEKAKGITMVVFDKTGTLTKGEPEVNQVIVNENYSFSVENIISIARSLARNSTHPLSQAVEKYAEKNGNGEIEIKNFDEIRGKGLSGIFKEHNIPLFLGNARLLEEKGVELDWAGKILNDQKFQGGSWLFIGHDKKIIGAIQIFDEIRPEAKKVIREIKRMDLKVGLISGDNKITTDAVANTLGIGYAKAEVLPQEKSAEIKKLQKDGERVAFVGDGINDAPPLIQADLGIAMGSATDVAKEAGEIILLQNNLEKVVEAVRLSRSTFSIIKQNLFWAFFYNILAIPLAALGFLNPIIAALAMSFSSVSVVANSLRIYRK